MKSQRRKFGSWELYPSGRATIGCKPYWNNIVYHVPICDLETEGGRSRWYRHIADKPESYDLPGFKLAIDTLLNDGTIKIKSGGN